TRVDASIGHRAAAGAFLGPWPATSRHAAADAPGARLWRAGAAWPALPSAHVAGGGMVLARWRARHRRAVLSRAPATDAPGAPHDARGRGWQPELDDAHPAPRGWPRHRHRLPPAASRALAAAVRPGLAALSRGVSCAAGQPAFRAAPRPLVCAGASHRGFRRDLRGVA